MQNSQQDLAHLRPAPNDELDLGQLIRNLIIEWKLIASVTAVGAIASVFIALSLPKIYQVNSIISLPTQQQLGSATEQNLIPINPEVAFNGLLVQLSNSEVQKTAYKNSSLPAKLSENAPELNLEVSFLEFQKSLKIERLDHAYNQTSKDEVAPLRDIKISAESQHPAEITNFINQLLDAANTHALQEFEFTVAKAKSQQIKQLKLDLENLTSAAETARKAKIQRMEEANNLKIAQLEQQLTTLLTSAKETRENRIIALEEALATAKSLNIVEPVTWDDLRPNRQPSQITNELGETTKASPLYFQGSRILSAEIQRLKSRKDDTPFISNYDQIKQDIQNLKNDPEIAALKIRENDTIYIDRFDELNQKLSVLQTVPETFPETTFKNITLSPVMPQYPIKPNKKLIAVAGTVFAGFLALFLAIIRIAIRPTDEHI